MAGLTVEERIAEQFGCPVSELLKEYATKGMTSKQVAEILQCGVSNVRRIARKYQVSFNQQIQNPTKILQDPEFKSENMNTTNFLSRPWRLNRVMLAGT